METRTDSMAIALKFNICIAFIEGLVDLMTDDHVFIDMANRRKQRKMGTLIEKLSVHPFFKFRYTFPANEYIFFFCPSVEYNL